MTGWWFFRHHCVKERPGNIHWKVTGQLLIFLEREGTMSTSIEMWVSISTFVKRGNQEWAEQMNGKNSPCVAPSACRARTICKRTFQGQIPIHLHLFLCAPGSRGEKSNLNCFFFRFNSPGASKTRALPNLWWIISHIFHTTLLHWVHYLAVLLGYTQSNMSMPRAQQTTRST